MNRTILLAGTGRSIQSSSWLIVTAHCAQEGATGALCWPAGGMPHWRQQPATPWHSEALHAGTHHVFLAERVLEERF